MPPFHIYTGSRPANFTVQMNYQCTVGEQTGRLTEQRHRYNGIRNAHTQAHVLDSDDVFAFCFFSWFNHRSAALQV